MAGPGDNGTIVTETDRLSLRRLTHSDADFVLELFNQPSFVEFIGDKEVRSLADAVAYLEEGPLSMYRAYGFGPYLVADRRRDDALGLCGLYVRDYMDVPDLGFAFLRKVFRRGYALEASRAVMRVARTEFHLERIAALADPQNARSIGLLEKLGFAFERSLVVPGENRDTHLFGIALTS